MHLFTNMFNCKNISIFQSLWGSKSNPRFVKRYANLNICIKMYSAVPSKNAVSANIKHSRYLH